MTLSVSSAEAIKELIDGDATLSDALHSASDRQELIVKITAAAQAKGITVDEKILGQVLDLALNHSAEHQELSEEQLENVAGGRIFAVVPQTRRIQV